MPLTAGTSAVAGLALCLLRANGWFGGGWGIDVHTTRCDCGQLKVETEECEIFFTCLHQCARVLREEIEIQSSIIVPACPNCISGSIYML